jgi:AcrR family transcriptional regulator
MTRKTRRYQSDIRSKQAGVTRQKILSAARSLFKTKGYEGTAIDAIASKAGVSTPTVYGVFGSKKEVLKELVESTMFGQLYHEAVEKVLSTSEPRERLRAMSGVARRVHDAKHAALDPFRGAGVVYPEIAALERENENRRYESQRPVIDYLFESDVIRKGISKQKARDIAWCLTGGDIYRMLVLEKGWSSDEYQQWLGEMLVRELT